MGLFNKSKKQETILVEGMKCVHCASKVVNALKERKVKAEVALEEKLVKVTFDENKITLQQIKTIIEEVGFTCL